MVPFCVLPYLKVPDIDIDSSLEHPVICYDNQFLFRQTYLLQCFELVIIMAPVDVRFKSEGCLVPRFWN